ncbi:MAG: peptide transporter [Clostridiales bacterium]|nr:peptide transporter [Clostridiales bacterium]
MKKYLCLLLCLFMLSTVLLTGCGKKDPEPVKPEVTEVKEPTGTLIAGITEASGNFNPLYYSSAYDGHVVDLVFEGLITRNFEGKYEGAVAESWEISEDGKTITFKMKKDKVFSDGTPVTANDVVFTYQVVADPSYTGRNGSLVKDMLGYDDYFAKKTQEFKGVEAVDEYTVKFNFKDALRVNLENCTSSILPKHYYGKDFAYNNTASVEAITSQAIGSGPYLIKEYKEKELILLERNMKFSEEGYMIKNVLMKFVDQTTDIVELTSGGVDLLPTVIEPEKIAKARDAGFSINKYQRSGYGYVKFNCGAGPTADKAVRQALYYSFNVEEFTNSYFKDETTGEILASTQYHPFSQISWAIDDKVVSEMNNYKFDLAKANKLLDDAGWVKNAKGIRVKDGKELELKVAAMPDHDILATLIPMWERDWGQGLGVKLNVAYLEFNTILDYVIYNSDANVNEWSLFFLATSITSPDPHTLYSEFHSSAIGSGKDNTGRYSNPKVDELFDNGKAIMNIEEAKPIYREAAKILNDDAAMVPVYANTYFDLYNSKITNFKTSSLYDWAKALKNAEIKE